MHKTMRKIMHKKMREIAKYTRRLLLNLLFMPVLTLANPAYADSKVDTSGVRLMTLNIAHARAMGASQLLQSTQKARDNLLEIADIIMREDPDIVAFQEIDSNSFWNGHFHHGQFLADKTEFKNLFVGSHQLGAQLDYGTGLMAHYDLSDSQSIRFRKPFARPSKGFVLSTIKWPELDNVNVDIVSVHLDFLSHAQRHAELETLAGVLANRDNLRIIMGDFNMEYEERHALIPKLSKELDLHTWRPYETELVTFKKMGTRLDWVLVSRDFRFINFRVLDDPISDHQPVVADLTLLSEPAGDVSQAAGL